MKIHFNLLAAILVIGILSCHPVQKGGAKLILSDKESPMSDTLPPFHLNPDSLMPIDFTQDLSGKSLPELRLLRSAVFARNGQLFKEPEIRGYFAAKYKWYNHVTSEIWRRIGDKVVNEPVLTSAEHDFVKKIDGLMKDKTKLNYADVNGNTLGVISNIVNLNKFEHLSPEFLEKLTQNNFVVLPEHCPQLFNIYEQNDYTELSDFVTSDLYLQVVHMYFSYMLRSLEKDHFIHNAERLSEQMCIASASIAQRAKDPTIKQLAEYNQVFFAVPHALLTGDKSQVPAMYKTIFEEELSNIMETTDHQSKLLDYFPYMIFKPRGHYTRNDTTKNYFRAMMWLQTAPFCLKEPDQLKHAVFMAYVLNSADNTMGNDYRSLYETISFLVGEPDNVSVMDVAAVLRSLNSKDITDMIAGEFMAKVTAQLTKLAKEKNRIKPKIEITCPDKINFLPQRYVFDNEILQELVDVRINAERAFPKGLDIWAALGNKTAEDILLKTYREGDRWKEYTPKLEQLKAKMAKFNDWDKSVYNKWFESLRLLQKKNKDMPPFMATKAWDLKTLSTSLASWAELKHDAILYAEEPNAAEMGGGPMPPNPIVKGYVEPNEAFWKKLIELVDLSQKMLQKHQLLTKNIENASMELNKQLSFMLAVTQKELRKKSLTDEENLYIREIGGHVDNLTLSILEPGSKASSWYEVRTLDTCVYVVADVYNRNVPECTKNGILYEGVGPVNNIYVVVEIDGFLYLTRGAVLSEYEFIEKTDDRLTDEDWQKRVTGRNLPPVHEWLKPLLLPIKQKPTVNESQFYRPDF